MFNLDATPYLIDDQASAEIVARLKKIEDRIIILRQEGMLNNETIRHYYGEKRFEQIAESNAIEGSTLSIGETELAVVKGITISGHDPAYSRDAVALDKALSRVIELARIDAPATGVEQLLEIHGLLLGERPSAGCFRAERVRISGSDHSPPKTGAAVRAAMEQWENWSSSNLDLPAPIRAAVLHAWLTHIHPFLDGNGRTSRAIGNLELIKAGYPPIIIKKKDRERYIQALSESDHGGDLRSFIELIFDKIDGGLTGLELSAKKMQGYDPVFAMIMQRRLQNLKIWQTGVSLLSSMIDLRLSAQVERLNGRFFMRAFDNALDIEDYDELCSGRSISGGWAFIASISISGFPQSEKLAYVQHRSTPMYHRLGREGGPAIFWSKRNPDGFPKWRPAFEKSPFAVELTSRMGSGDEWIARLADGTFIEMNTTQAAESISRALLVHATQQDN